MNINIFDFTHTSHDTGVDVNDIVNIDVQVISGDEILCIEKKDGTIEVFDAVSFSHSDRIINYHDMSYELSDKKEIKRWLKRENSYGWFF